MIGTIDTSWSSIRIGLIMIMGTVWFWLVIDTIMNSNREE
tara:strand:+ start:2027 stop:2146 length:120 start_codon:yes stop_codon:yes gene_type:complete